jgi:hypothetical protein
LAINSGVMATSVFMKTDASVAKGLTVANGLWQVAGATPGLLTVGLEVTDLQEGHFRLDNTSNFCSDKVG